MTRYVVVFRDHAGDWHAVATHPTWELAVAAFGAMIGALIATDYYDDCPPTIAKIIPSGADYATAASLSGPIVVSGGYA